jgi:hypothetical protein
VSSCDRCGGTEDTVFAKAHTDPEICIRNLRRERDTARAEAVDVITAWLLLLEGNTTSLAGSEVLLEAVDGVKKGVPFKAMATGDLYDLLQRIRSNR